jgi:hypothetical protein
MMPYSPALRRSSSRVAAKCGPPFTEFLVVLRQTRAAWGDTPTAAQVDTGLRTLGEKARGLTP